MPMNAVRYEDRTLLLIDEIQKAELAQRFGVSRETLHKKLKEVEGSHTGRRQLIYPYELSMVYEAFGRFLVIFYEKID